MVSEPPSPAMGVTIRISWLAASKMAPMRKLVSGPAMAKRHSMLGVSGISSISETPPMGYSTILRTLMW